MIIGKNIETKEDVNIDLQTLIKSRLLIQANSGAGKSWLIRRLLERSFGKVQQIVIDLEGEFSTLRDEYDYLLIGKDGEITAKIQTAELLARKLLVLNVSTIIDLSELKHHERITFVKRFLDSLVNAPRELWHTCLVVIDEAHQFCAEKTKSESASSVIDLMTRGRKRGFCGVLATQRISKLHKDAAAECNNVLVGRTVQDIDRKRASDDLGFTTKEQSRSLRRLGDGEFFAYGPAISKEDIIKIKVGDVRTAHPEPGKSILQASETPKNIKKLLKEIIDLPKEVEEELRTKKEFQKRIQDLKKEIRILNISKPKLFVNEKIIEKARQQGFREAEMSFKKQYQEIGMNFKKQYQELEKNYRVLEKKLSSLGKIFGQDSSQIQKIPTFNPNTIQLNPQIQKTREVTPQVKSSIPLREKVTFPLSNHSKIQNDYDDEIKLSPAYSRMLKVCASFYPESLTRSKLAILSNVPKKASTFRNGLSKLKNLGLIEVNSEIVICSEEGIDIAGEVEEIPKGNPEALLQIWVQKLSPAYSRMLNYLFSIYPNSSSREELSMNSEIPIDASTFRNGLSKLKTLGLIKVEGGELAISSDFFE